MSELKGNDNDEGFPVNFLEAHQLCGRLSGAEPLNYRLCMAGTSDPLLIYLRAMAARRGMKAEIEVLPFGTLGQTIATAPSSGKPDVFLLLGSDIVQRGDLRSGIPDAAPDWDTVAAEATATARRLSERSNSRFAYLPGPLAPLWLDPARNRALAYHVLSLAEELRALILPETYFSLSSLFVSGCPIGGAYLANVAEALDGLLQRAAGGREATGKVLVTDLDNTLWHGVIAEDGVEGIYYQPEGLGYSHFVYQTMLRKLKAAGVLLAAVSRNDHEVAVAPLRSGQMVLGETDFVHIAATYASKSGQIKQLARMLNLGLDSFVFVDDNPIELAEVSKALPQLKLLAFPKDEADLPALLDDITLAFERLTTTDEDRRRTELYRRQVEYMPTQELEGASLTEFLRGLGMRLRIRECSASTSARAVQLINKTSQFNLNGRLISTERLESALQNGARLYSASLKDRIGDHGEILVMLIDVDGRVPTFVMSCRVFQREVEFAMLAWVLQRHPELNLEHARTDKNMPFRQFIAALGQDESAINIALTQGSLCIRAKQAGELFQIDEP